jgi:hypothetical protein
MKKILAFVLFIFVFAAQPVFVVNASSSEQPLCVPTTDKLYLYNFSSRIEITNHGGVYDPSNGFEFDYTRKCKVSPITKILVEDNSGITEYPSSGYGRFELSYTTLNVPNCWQISRVSAYGESEQSNKVCYTPPIVNPVKVTGIYMYQNSYGQMDGNVYIHLQKDYFSSIFWTSCDVSKSSWTFTSSSWSTSFIQKFTNYGNDSSGYQYCMLVYAKDEKGILSLPFKVEFTYSLWMAQPYNTASNPNYQTLLYTPPVSSNFSGYNYGLKNNNCVGICYGVPSKLNGLPRNTYVNGYYRSNGTWVNPYTRSKP